MKIGIVGSRRRTRHEDYIALHDAFLKLYEKQKIGTFIEIVSGGCPKGADSWAEDIAEEFHLKIQLYEADWHQFGRVAGILRNTYIATDADVLIACVAADRTGGTEDTIRKFQKLHPKGELILV